MSEESIERRILDPVSPTTGDKWKKALYDAPQGNHRYLRWAMSQETLDAYALGSRKVKLQEEMNQKLIMRAMDMGHIMTLEEEKTLPQFDFLIEMSEPIKPEEMISSILGRPVMVDNNIPFGEFEIRYGEPFKG